MCNGCGSGCGYSAGAGTAAMAMYDCGGSGGSVGYTASTSLGYDGAGGSSYNPTGASSYSSMQGMYQ